MYAQNRKRLQSMMLCQPVMDSHLSYEEFNSTSKLKLKTSPGPHAITNGMIVNLGHTVLHTPLDIFNKTWQEGILPQIWRETTMIPIHKKEKEKQKQKHTDTLA